MLTPDPFEVVPYVHEGLGNNSYLVGVGESRAVVVDPWRRIERYLEGARDRDWEIVAVVETHLHADFVTGALDLRDRTGARLWHPANDGAAFAHAPARAGERLSIGEVEVEIRATPSHTPEHVAYVMHRAAAPPLAFTGGALIVGGAARTDLVAPDRTEALTRALFDSRRAFDDLPDETGVLPTHGEGSFCSSGAGGERVSTLGAERARNTVMGFDGDEDAFAAWFPTTFPGTPAYYARMRGVNAAGPRPVDEVDRPAKLDVTAAMAASAAGALVVDVRSPPAFASGHIPGSLAIPFRDSFCVWLGWLAPADASLLFVVEAEPIDDVVGEAMLVGFERFTGVLEGGVRGWREAGFPLVKTVMADPAEAATALGEGAELVDVREPDEVAGGTIEGAVTIPLGDLGGRATAMLPKNRPVITMCAAGERSITAASILEREGFGTVVNLSGGYDGWRAAQA